MLVTGGRDAIQTDLFDRGRQCIHNSILSCPESLRKSHRVPRACLFLDREEGVICSQMWDIGLRHGDHILLSREHNSTVIPEGLPTWPLAGFGL